jgi:hypothetical protein
LTHRYPHDLHIIVGLYHGVSSQYLLVILVIKLGLLENPSFPSMVFAATHLCLFGDLPATFDYRRVMEKHSQKSNHFKYNVIWVLPTISLDDLDDHHKKVPTVPYPESQLTHFTNHSENPQFIQR